MIKNNIPKSLSRLCQEKILKSPSIYKILKTNKYIISEYAWDRNLELLYNATGKFDPDSNNEITPIFMEKNWKKKNYSINNINIYNTDSDSSDGSEDSDGSDDSYYSNDDSDDEYVDYNGNNGNNNDIINRNTTIWFDDWVYISSCININNNIEFFKVYHIYINWNKLVKIQTIYPTTIYEIKSIIQGYNLWDYIIKYQRVSPEQLIEYAFYINWDLATKYQKITEEIIINKYQFINWENIILYQKHLPITFLANYRNYINWDFFFKSRKLTNYDIKFALDNHIYFNYQLKDLASIISKYQLDNIDNELIYKYANVFNWDYLSIKANFDIDLIRKYKNFINWNIFCSHNHLEKPFLIEFKHYINWLIVFSYHPHIDFDFIKEYKCMADQNLLNIIEYEYGDIEYLPFKVRETIIPCYLSRKL